MPTQDAEAVAAAQVRRVIIGKTNLPTGNHEDDPVVDAKQYV